MSFSSPSLLSAHPSPSTQLQSVPDFPAFSEEPEKKKAARLAKAEKEAKQAAKVQAKAAKAKAAATAAEKADGEAGAAGEANGDAGASASGKAGAGKKGEWMVMCLDADDVGYLEWVT